MTTADYGLLIYWGISSLLMVVIGIIGMIKSREKTDFVDSFLMTLVGFTPSSVIVVTIGLMFGLMFLLTEIPSKLFDFFKRDK